MRAFIPSHPSRTIILFFFLVFFILHLLCTIPYLLSSNLASLTHSLSADIHTGIRVHTFPFAALHYVLHNTLCPVPLQGPTCREISIKLIDPISQHQKGISATHTLTNTQVRKNSFSIQSAVVLISFGVLPKQQQQHQRSIANQLPSTTGLPFVFKYHLKEHFICVVFQVKSIAVALSASLSLGKSLPVHPKLSNQLQRGKSNSHKAKCKRVEQ